MAIDRLCDQEKKGIFTVATFTITSLLGKSSRYRNYPGMMLDGDEQVEGMSEGL